ncbi:phosphatidylserine decarboxylase [Cochlodiniinecator piscidefendens]|uniref:phosphatidylserine decarboxylase n=1 Tax=Cochlodiniinecator piscidefendens TaxID=2715756 RepID=UPI00140B1B32|nr:phosphatidylserine decarboxylase [Cochlodiniinecator piscidefendens]
MSNPLKIIAVPMHPEGRKFVAIFAAVSIVLGSLWMPLFWIGAGLTVWCYYFFRDPVRSVPQVEGRLVSPADGVVSLITRMVPPAELALDAEERVRVSVFMNVFNCHVNRMPMQGTIKKISYHHGKFLNASLDKASEHNERNALTIRSDNGTEIGVVQIAGLVARRIVCFTQEGENLERGERFGLIRFGSRLDIYLPPGVEPQVVLGQTTVAGETILANLEDPATVWSGARI